MQNNQQSTIYQVHIMGHLDQRWLRGYDDLLVSQSPDGQTTITGAMDQAALHGILNRIRDLGLELISVQQYRSQDDVPKDLSEK
jgi:hypothetical protein